MKLHRDDILAAESVQALGFDVPRSFAVIGASTDSRSVRAGELFVALRGDRFDGHDFVTAAVQAGAAAVVVDRRWAEANRAMLVSITVPRLIVEDTVKALGALARRHRRKFKIPILAVGGSNGKTTTKEMISSVLAQKYRVLRTEGNLNNHIGVPLTMFRLEGRHQAAVLEFGTNHPGEIRTLCEIAEPTHGLITNIGQEHLEFFGSVDGVAKAEGELFDWLAGKGTGVVNADESRIVRQARSLKKKLTFGMKAGRHDVRGTVLNFSPNGCPNIRIRKRGGTAFAVRLRVPGEHNARNALAAAAAGMALRVPAEQIQQSLETFTAPGKRMEVHDVGGMTVVNDTYNANPDSVLAALAALRSMKTQGKKIVVLGDMLELGPDSADLHRAIGKKLSSFGVDVLLTFGPLSRQTNDAAGVTTKLHFDDKNILAVRLIQQVSAGDIVLVKGSRGMKMEDVVAAFIARFQKAA